MDSLGVYLADPKKVLLLFLHQELLPPVSFEYGRVGFQLFQLSFCDGDLLFVVLLAFLQFQQFASFAEVAGNQITRIKKKDPDDKARTREQVPVLQKRRDAR